MAIKYEIVCNRCGCLLPINDEMRKDTPHKCWVKLVDTILYNLHDIPLDQLKDIVEKAIEDK